MKFFWTSKWNSGACVQKDNSDGCTKDEQIDGKTEGEADKELLAKDEARQNQNKGRKAEEVIDWKKKSHQQLAADWG